jgi:hypothetical protein
MSSFINSQAQKSKFNFFQDFQFFLPIVIKETSSTQYPEEGSGLLGDESLLT